MRDNQPVTKCRVCGEEIPYNRACLGEGSSLEGCLYCFPEVWVPGMWQDLTEAERLVAAHRALGPRAPAWYRAQATEQENIDAPTGPKSWEI